MNIKLLTFIVSLIGTFFLLAFLTNAWNWIIMPIFDVGMLTTVQLFALYVVYKIVSFNKSKTEMMELLAPADPYASDEVNMDELKMVTILSLMYAMANGIILGISYFV